MSEHGRVLAVNRVRLGSQLIGAHALGATSLAVEDGSDFDEAGGTLQVGAQTVDYLSRVDLADDTATLTLSAGLSAAADDGDPVLLWDASRAVQASEVYAEVEIDGESGGDPIGALVAHHLIGDLPEGIRSLVGESVRLEEDGDDWIVVDVLGISETGGGPKWESNDAHTLTAGEVTAGTFTHYLKHSRIIPAHEFTAYVNGVALGPDRYTLDADKGKVTVTLGGWETTADNLRFHYAYRNGPVGVVVTTPFTPTQIGSTGYTNNTTTTATVNLAMPAGTQVGDLLILAALNHGGHSCTDPRFTVAATTTGFSIGLDGTVWVGRADTLGSVPITFTAGGGNDWTTASLTVIRGAGGEQTFLAAGPPALGSGTGPTGNIPAVSGPGRSGGICVFLTRDGTGGVYGDQDWSRSPGWTLKNAYDYSYVEIDVALTANSPNPAALTPNTDSDAEWRAYVFEVLPA